MSLLELENKLLFDLRESALTLVAHDAGGANVLAAFIRTMDLVPEKLQLAGPAIKILQGLKRDLESNNSNRPEITLATTGWKSDFEKKNIRQSLEKGQRTIIFLDHWTNFQERLLSEDGPLLISELVTFDEEARRLAENTFPESTVYLFPNYYLNEQCKEILDLRSQRTNFKFDFLFLGEPIRNKEYSESDSFKYFRHKILDLGISNLNIGVRPHPSMRVSHYRQLVKEFTDFQVTITTGTTLAEDLSDTRAAVGCNSMALHVANLCQIPAYCAIPEPFKSDLPSQIFKFWKSGFVNF